MNNMTACVVLGAILLHSYPAVIDETLEVECVELNQVWDITYEHIPGVGQACAIKTRLAQTIGWKWDRDHIYHVDWWVWDIQEPMDYRDGWWIFYLHPRHGDPVRVRARKVIWTHTIYDPEVEDRNMYQESMRGGLYQHQHVRRSLDNAVQSQ